MHWLKNLDTPLYRSDSVVSVWHVCEGSCLRKEETKLRVRNRSAGPSSEKVGGRVMARGRVMTSSLSPRLCSVSPGPLQGDAGAFIAHAEPTWVLHWSFASVSMAKSFSITSIFK